MRRLAGISVTALGMVALIGTAGCTKTSDGSIVMRKPSFNSILGFGGLDFGGDEQPARIVPSQTLDPAPASPISASTAPRRITRSQSSPTQSQSSVTIPSMSLTDNPPFTRPDPAKPISCHNETGSAGRIRFVCS